MISDKMLKIWRKQALLLREALSGFEPASEFLQERKNMANQICQLCLALSDERIIAENTKEESDIMRNKIRKIEERGKVTELAKLNELCTSKKKSNITESDFAFDKPETK